MDKQQMQQAIILADKNGQIKRTIALLYSLLGIDW